MTSTPRAETAVVPVEDELVLVRRGAVEQASRVCRHAGWSALCEDLDAAAPATHPGSRGEGEAVADLWRSTNLSRLDRVRAHRVEFGSNLKTAVEAVDADAAAKELQERAAPALPVSAADWIAEHERPDPNDAEAEIASLRLQLEVARQPVSAEDVARVIREAFGDGGGCVDGHDWSWDAAEAAQRADEVAVAVLALIRPLDKQS